CRGRRGTDVRSGYLPNTAFGHARSRAGSHRFGSGSWRRERSRAGSRRLLDSWSDKSGWGTRHAAFLEQATNVRHGATAEPCEGVRNSLREGTQGEIDVVFLRLQRGDRHERDDRGDPASDPWIG